MAYLKLAAFLICAAIVQGELSPVIQIPEYASRTDVQRIIQGWPAVPNQFPHQVHLRMVINDGSLVACGGSLISRNYVLTAAHCIDRATFVFARMGSINVTTPGLILESRNFMKHPQFNSFNLNNDMALVNLGRNVQESDSIRVIRLPRLSQMSETFVGTIATVSGWGNTQDTGTTSESLNYVNLTVITNQRCLQDYDPQTVITSTICAAGIQSPAQSSCYGDSGGALYMTESDGIRTQIGVVSFVSNLGCSVDRAAGFVRPHHFWPWISSNTGIPIRN
ncbi:collagenase-like [Arctopsyche grandis]|uniref:collagenase-like n=1 Tax=Arctopsyche grandis TaxID=121162 RepID=UPI00406D6617